MEYRLLGRSGLQVSAVALGTMNFGRPTEKEEAYRIVDAAVDAGINLIDCADIYAGGESERILGEAFKRNGKRPEVLITSKVFNRMGPGPNDLGLSKHHILDGCEKSLRRLQMDHIDIYFLHRPDFGVPMEEVALSRERMYQAILEDVSVFMNIPLKIEMQKAIARGQGETAMRLYKAE